MVAEQIIRRLRAERDAARAQASSAERRLALTHKEHRDARTLIGHTLKLGKLGGLVRARNQRDVAVAGLLSLSELYPECRSRIGAILNAIDTIGKSGRPRTEVPPATEPQSDTDTGFSTEGYNFEKGR